MSDGHLKTEINLIDRDSFYAELIAAQKGLSSQDGAAFSARLVLILANHIGDNLVLSEAIKAARGPDQA